MIEMDAFDRLIASEVVNASAPPRPVDDGAIFAAITATRSPRSTFWSLLGAGRLVVAGAIVALFAGLLVAGAFMRPSDDVVPAVGASAPVTLEPEATVSPEAAAQVDRADTRAATVRSDILPGADLVVEEVEPGVVRIISDGAGHDLDATRPMTGTRKDGIAVTPDGAVWLTTAHTTQRGDWNLSASPSVWALGRPGSFTIPEGVWTATETPILLISDVDGELLFVADTVVRFDGQAFVPDDGPRTRQLRAGGMIWLIGPEALAGIVPDGAFGFQCAKCGVLPAIWDGWKWASVSEYASRAVGTSLGNAPLGTACWTDGDGVACGDGRLGEVRYLEGTAISQIEMAPDGSIWAVGDHDDHSLGLYRIARESSLGTDQAGGAPSAS